MTDEARASGNCCSHRAWLAAVVYIAGSKELRGVAQMRIQAEVPNALGFEVEEKHAPASRISDSRRNHQLALVRIEGATPSEASF